MLSSRRALIVLCLSVLVPSEALTQTRAPGSLAMRVDGQESVLLAADLATLPRHEQRVTLDGTDQTATVSGVRLWDLLQRARVPSPTASGRQRAVMYIRLTGSDGQNAVVSLAEIDPSFTKRVVLVADRRNGQPLAAAEGPWRVFIPDDLRHARWIRGLASVEVLTLK